MSASSTLANDIEDELRAKNLSAFVLRKESKVEELFIEVWENQSYHPVLNTWGSVVGVHLNAVLDRSPFTDETGTKVLSGSLSEVRPLNKYKWQGEWTVRADNTTDNTGFQYAASWSLLSNKYKPATSSSSLMYVRRRRFVRKMVVDPDPPSKALPYELTIKVISANVQGIGSVTHSYVEVFLDKIFLDRTAACPPQWNHKLTKKIMQIDPELTITFVLYSKKTFSVVNPFQSQAPLEMIHRGTAHLVVSEFLQNLAVINKEDALDLISPTGQKIGTISIRLDVLETKLFSVVSAVDDSMEELQKRTEEAIPYDIRYDISSLDNDDNQFLKVLVKSVIEGRDVMTEVDLIDIVSEAAFLQNVDPDQFDERSGKPKMHQQAQRYPSGKPRYSKLITLPSTLVERNNVSIVRGQLTRALLREEELQSRNEYYDQSLPAVSSVFEASSLGVSGFDLAYQPYQSDAAKSDYYDLVIYCLPEDGIESETAHTLRWTSYYDYIMMIRELVKIQHQFHRDDAINAIVRHTCKVLYGAAEGKGAKPTSWIPVSFTVDSEAEFLVIRESRVAREDQPESFDKIISFDQVDGIVVRNTYHLSSHYALDLRVHAASSVHLRNVLANIHIETTDGRQRFTYKSEAFRKGSAPEGKPGTVTFPDSYTFMLPASALNAHSDPSTRESLHMTFSSEENVYTDTPAVQGRLDVPLHAILPSIGTNMADCQVTLRNVQQEYELHLKVQSINNLFWKDPANLFNIDFTQNEDADPYYVVYFADEKGQIIPLKESGAGAAAVVQDLASNLAYLTTAGMVGTKAEGTSVVGNVARDLVYLSTAGMVGGNKPDPKKQGQGSLDDHSSSHGTLVGNVGNVANNLVYLSTAGTFGSKSTPAANAKGDQSTPRKATGGILNIGAGAKSVPDQQKTASKASIGDSSNTPGRRSTGSTDKRLSTQGSSSNIVAKAAGDAASGLISLGAASIQGTSNVIVGTSNVAVNVLTLGNAGIVSSMNKADAVYTSSVVNKTLNPAWEDDVVLSTEKFGDVMRNAKYLLIEVWDKNTALADECLGEVYLPIVCAHKLDANTNLDRVPRTTGLHKYPLQISKHMKINRAAAKRLPTGLGSMRAQLLYQEAPLPPDATARERGDHDPINVNLILQVKPVGALDFAWPSRIISSELTAEVMEQDILYARLKHDGLELSITATATPSDRVKMLMECREKTKATTSGSDKNLLCLLIPYDQIHIGDSSILTTDALQCNVTFTRIVMSTTQKGKEIERPATLDLLIGPCPACDVFAILQQRVTLTGFRQALKKIAGVQVKLSDVDAIAADLQGEILNTSHDLEDMSTKSNSTSVLENILMNTAATKSEKAAEGAVIFADKINRMSVTYFSTKLHTRVLMVRKAFLKTFLWYTLEFSKFSVSKIVGKTVLPNFDKEIDMDAIAVLTKRCRSTLKYGDPNKLGDGTDSDDSDEDEERAAKRRAKREVSTASLVNRVKDIMAQMSQDLRNILFQGYRRKFPSSYVQFLATKLVYEQYLVIVGYLTGILLDDDQAEAIPSAQHAGAIQSPDNSYTAQMMQFTSVATSALTLGTVKLHTGNAVAAPAPQKGIAKKIDAQRKHDLISFVLSQDNLFEQYLHANLFSFENKFSARPHLSMCLDFDVLIGKFSDIMNENIQMWNSKALKVFMCRKVEEGVKPSRLPWDITTMKDDMTGNEMYISHIPESIQIQLNVQIGMKKINTAGMGDTLSIMSIKRIYEINLKIAKAIARAYLSLAVEYENFLEETTSALEAEGEAAGNRVTALIQNIGVKMIEVGTLGVINVGEGGAGSGGTSARTAEEVHEDSDELLCFLMSIVNDCTRINKEHIPQSIVSFVKEFADGGEAVLQQAPGSTNSASNSRESSAHGPKMGGVTPGLTAAEEINGYFFNSIKAIKSVARNAVNCLTNQVFFHGDLKEYFLRTFSDHLLVKTNNNTLLSLVKGAGGEGTPVDKDGETAAPPENPVSTIVATLQDMYGFTASHVGTEDQNHIVHNCLKKVIMRYLLMLRDLLIIKGSSRLSSALNTGINSGINTGMKMGRTVLQVTTLGLVGNSESDKGSADNLHEMDRSTSSAQTNSLSGESYTPAQVAEIRTDLETIMNAHLDINDDKVAELLQFFNKSVNTILSGATCDPRAIDKILLDRFHLMPPVFNSDPAQYDRGLEAYIGLNAQTHELSQEEVEQRMNKVYTIQFQELTCVNLKDYRLCVVRISFANITLQSSILSSDMVGNAQIRWKDILRFEHVKGYQNKDVLVEIVEIRPLGLRRELVLARVRIQLAQLSQFINPEPYPASTGGKIVSNPNAGHSGWYVLEEVAPELYTSKGITNMLRDATVGTINTTASVTNATLQTTMNVTNSTVNAVMAPLRSNEDADALNTSSTSKLSNSSTGKSSSTGKPAAGAAATAATTAAPAGKTKNSLLNILSSDQPRENVKAPQLKIRIRIVEEKE